MSDTTGTPGDGGTADGRAVYADAAARLERVIDAQIAALDDTDARAMTVMRLVGGLLGVFVSLLSLAAALGGRLPVPSATALAALLLGALGLVGTLVAAALTYLGSRVVPGVGPGMTDDVLDGPGAPPAEAAHLRRVVATYADAVRANRAALAANARRFRVTLLLLVTGLSYGTYGALTLAVPLDGPGGVSALVVLTGALAAVWWYVLSGRYLTDAATAVPDGEVVTSEVVGDPTSYPVAVIERGGEE